METDTAAYRDWSALPVDLLLSAMASMEVLDIIHSGAVCSSWRAAYASFRAIRLPTPPRQTPCLLYYAGDAADGCSGLPTLYCPSTNANFPVNSHGTPHRRRGRIAVGSAHGWLFTADEEANPYLLNPITGARAALPPITTLDRVKSSFLDDDGGVVYNVECGWGRNPDIKQISAQRARDWIYHRVTVSGSPLAAAACVVLLTHNPCEELSFARLGDERWTLIGDIGSPHGGYIVSTVYNDKDGLFYVLRFDDTVHVLDLRSSCPVMRLVKGPQYDGISPPSTRYLAVTSRGSLLLVRRNCRSQPAEISGDGCANIVIATTDVQLEKVDVTMNRKVRRLRGLDDDDALFLGRNSALCLPIIKNSSSALSSMLERNRAYLTDDGIKEFSVVGPPRNQRDLVVWDFERGTMQKLDDVWPLHPWLDSPAAIWFTPSLC